MIHELMNKIAQTIPTMHGWCSVEKAQTLASIVIATRPSTIVEVGVYAGRSVIPMAMACKHVGYGRVVAIDAWDNQAAMKNEVQDHAEWWSKIDMPAMKAAFLKSVSDASLEPFVTVIQDKSDNVMPPASIGLLHVDGSHTDQAISDVERFAPCVERGGIVVLDDLDWAGGGVRRAIDVLVDEIGAKMLYQFKTEADNWAVFQKL